VSHREAQCGVMQYGAMRCSVLQRLVVKCACAAVCCKCVASVLQVCCSVLQSVAVRYKCIALRCRGLQCVAERCSMLKYFANYYSLLQCVASVLQYGTV